MDQEQINDRYKRAFHRIVARSLRDSPELVDEAKAVVKSWKSYSTVPGFVRDWETLLARPVEEIRREITRPNENATRLRTSSPFSLIPTRIIDGQKRNALWRKVRRTAHTGRSTT